MSLSMGGVKVAIRDGILEAWELIEEKKEAKEKIVRAQAMSDSLEELAFNKKLMDSMATMRVGYE